MTVDTSGFDAIHLSGDCGLEDAEPLLRALLAAPTRPVNWTRATSAHTAIIQVLIALEPAVDGPPASLYLRKWIHPLLKRRYKASDTALEQTRP